MKSAPLKFLASTLLATFGLVSVSWAQQNDNRREQSQSEKSSEHSSSQESSDDEETEYRGMEHAALGVMLGEQTGRGVRVRDLLSGSPADRAGLRAGDRITKIDDKQMQSYRDFIRFVNRVEPGQKAKIIINRDGEEKTLDVRFASHEELYGDESDEHWQQSRRPARESSQRRQSQYDYSSGDQSNQYNETSRNDGARRRQNESGQQEYRQQSDQYGQNDDNTWRGYDRGQTIQRRQQRGLDARQNNYGREDDWNNQRRQYGSDSRQFSERSHGLLGVDLDDQSGSVMVRRVWSGSPAERAGVRRGDEILSLDGEDIDDQDDLIEELRDYQPGERVRLTIYRNGEERTVRPRLASQQELTNQQGYNQTQSRSRNDQWRQEDRDYDRSTSRPRLRQAQRENYTSDRDEDR